MGQPVINSYEDQEITAPDAAASDRFGISVGVDGNVAVIGAYLDYNNGNNSGSAYVFEKVNSEWINTACLLPTDGHVEQRFGFAVAISGETIVVGAPHSQNSTGAAYVFVKPVNGWENMTETGKLAASDFAINDQFGLSVAIDGSEIIIGAPFDDLGFTNMGS